MYSLLTQLVRGLVREDSRKPHFYHLPRAFRELYNKYRPASEPKIEDLNETFLRVLAESKETYIIIDALDECSVEERKEVIRFLAELSQGCLSNTHILITSRREEDIEKLIRKRFDTENIVPIQNLRVNDDIRKHLQSCFEEDESLKEFSPELQTIVIEYLTEKADGVFRWVECQLITLKGLKSKSRKKDVERALNQLPKDLDETCNRMLQQIHESLHSNEACSVLKWLAFSKRDLKLNEVAEAAIFEPDPEHGHVSFDPGDRFGSPLEIRAILSGLVTVPGLDYSSRLGVDTGSGQDEIISFAHFSVKEYLESDRVKPEVFRLLETHQWFILESCLAYIHHYDTKKSEEAGSGEYPLLLYACKYWPHHAVELCCGRNQYIKETPVKRLAELLTEFNGPTLTLTTRVALRLQRHPFRKILQSALLDWLKYLEDENTFTEPAFDFEGESALTEPTFDFEGYIALHLASSIGGESLVKLLLDCKANVNREDGNDRTALHYAAQSGHERVVELLIQKGTHIEIKDTNGATPLACAIENGSEAVIKLLLAIDARVDYDYKPSVSELNPCVRSMANTTVLRRCRE
jgi:hypothetical protein